MFCCIMVGAIAAFNSDGKIEEDLNKPLWKQMFPLNLIL